MKLWLLASRRLSEGRAIFLCNPPGQGIIAPETATTSPQMPNHYDSWQTDSFDCTACGRNGSGAEMSRGEYDPGRASSNGGVDPMDVGDLRRIAQSEPSDWRHWFRLGYRYLEVCEPQSAIDPWLRTIALAPENALAHFLLSKAYAQIDANVQAIANLEIATRLRPDFAKAWKLLGALLLDADRYREALTSLKHAIHLEPRGETYWQLALCLISDKNYREAIVVLEECVRLKDNHVPAHRTLAFLGCLMQEPDTTVRHLRRLYEIDEDVARLVDSKIHG